MDSADGGIEAASRALKEAEALVRDGRYGEAVQAFNRIQAAGRKVLAARVRAGLADAPGPRTGVLFDLLGRIEAIDEHAFVGAGLATWQKILPFMADPRFHRLAARVAPLHPLPNWHWNLQTVLWAVQHTRDVAGDLVELGVFRGHTSLFCAEYVEFAGWPKTWWLYDTFEGIPDDQQDPGWAEKNRAVYQGTFSFAEVAARFAHFPNVRVIQGRVPEVLASAGPDRIAFLHIDLNNTAAEIGALDALFDRISPGGVVVFDDFCWAAAAAQHQAEVRWFAARGLHVLPLPTGQGVFVKR